MTTIAQDLRYALRILARSPGFTAVAIITLALGIGANTAIFSLVDSVMLRNLPVRNPKGLVLFADNPGQGMSMSEPTPNQPMAVRSGQWTEFPYPFYQDLRDHDRLFRGICAFQSPDDSLTLRLQDHLHNSAAQVAVGKMVSGNFFSILGVRAVLGRTLTPEDDKTGAPPVAVVSYKYWQSKLGADPAVVGRNVDIDGVPMTLVGVMPPGFFGVRMTADGAEFWMPLSLRPKLPVTVMPQAKSLLTSPNIFWLDLMGRVKPGVSLRQANAEVNLHLRNYLTAWVGSKMTAGLRHGIEHAYVSLAPGGRGLSRMRFQYSEPLYILLAIVALVLLIACANVANLLLSRATARRKEMAMRLALGATRGRLIRQMLVESVLLAIAGGILGALLASWGVSVLVSLAAAGTPLNVKPDFAVFGFTVGVSLLTVILAGLAPALRAIQVDLVSALKSGPGSAESRAFRDSAAFHPSPRKVRRPAITAGLRYLGLGKSLVIFQIAVSLLLLIGAGLLIHSLLNLEDQNLGFNPEHVLLVGIHPELAGYKSKQLPGLYHDLVDRISAVPGVRSASIGLTSPMSGAEASADVGVEGQTEHLGEGGVRFVPVGPNYFETEGMHIVADRGFSLQDRPKSTQVVVVNEAFARRFLPRLNPIGRRISFGHPFTAPGMEIVGVVANAKYASAREQADPTFFVSAYQMESVLADLNEVEIRVAGNPAAITAEVRKAIHAIDQKLPIGRVTTLTKQVSDSLGQQRAISDLTAFFGILGLVLACVGLYGIMAYNVARRTNEIGVRMALGAARSDVLWMILRQTLVLIVVGFCIGIPVALGAARLIASQLYGVKPADPLTIAIAALVMAGVGVLAGYLPARRASRVDPMVALRYE